MRYTLRLLTLDQLSRAAGVVCALELMRGEPAWQRRRRAPARRLADRDRSLGRLRRLAEPARQDRATAGPDTAVARVRRYRTGRPRGAGADQGLPVVRRRRSRATASPACRTTRRRTNMEIRCANPACDFTGDRALPVLTVDEAIYRRLPAFLIATVDKFAGLPWLGEAGAFFGHVDREDEWGFYGAAEPRDGHGRSRQRRTLDAARPHHPGRAAPDQRPARHRRRRSTRRRSIGWRRARRRASASGRRSSPPRRRSGAPARRSRRCSTGTGPQIFPPPGPDRRDSFFAHDRAVVAEAGPALCRPRRARARARS